jgi:hypothetical protein
MLSWPPPAEAQALDLLPEPASPPTTPILGEPFKAAKISSNGFGAVSINDNPSGD